VKVCRGERLKDCDLIGKMDPYCVLTVGAEKFKTKVMKKAGTNPIFNQNFIFNLDGKTDPVMHILCMDEDLVSDDCIGRVDIRLADFCKTHLEQPFQIVDKGNFKKINGTLVMQCVSYNGSVLPNQPPKVAPAPVAAAAPAAAPTVVYVQQQPQYVQQQPQYQQQPQVVYAQQPQQRVVYAQQPQVVYVQQPQVVYMPQQPRQM